MLCVVLWGGRGCGVVLVGLGLGMGLIEVGSWGCRWGRDERWVDVLTIKWVG